MNMTPFFSLDGVLIGHVDVSMCRRIRNAVMIDNGPDKWSMPVPTDGKKISPDDCIGIFRIPLREILFCSGDERQTSYHLVVDDMKLPKWFWDNNAIVAFSPGSWDRVRP